MKGAGTGRTGSGCVVAADAFARAHFRQASSQPCPSHGEVPRALCDGATSSGSRPLADSAVLFIDVQLVIKDP